MQSFFNILIIFILLFSSYCSNNNSNTIGKFTDTIFIGWDEEGIIYKFYMLNDSTSIFRYNDKNNLNCKIRIGEISSVNNEYINYNVKKALTFSSGISSTLNRNFLNIEIDSISFNYLRNYSIKVTYLKNRKTRLIDIDNKIMSISMDSCNEKNDSIIVEFNLEGFGLKEFIKLNILYKKYEISIKSQKDSIGFRLTKDSIKLIRFYKDLPYPDNIDSHICILR